MFQGCSHNFIVQPKNKKRKEKKREREHLFEPHALKN